MKASTVWALLAGVVLGGAAVAFLTSEKGKELRGKVEKYLADRDIYFTEEKLNEFVMKVREKLDNGIQSLEAAISSALSDEKK